MTDSTIRHVGTVHRTSTYKVTDPSVADGGEAVVIVVDGVTVNCLTCPGYKCIHADTVRRHVEDQHGRA